MWQAGHHEASEAAAWSERVKVVELARNETARIPAVLDEFAAKLEELGPNPLKGFG